ncbi:MAG: hypothetical protein ACLQM8_04990 [Limisphaerales bacterium]
MNISNLTPEQLRSAADLKEKIDGLQNELNEVLGGEASAAVQPAVEAPQRPANGRRGKRKKVSPEGLANIRAAAKARWAARRMEKMTAMAAEPEQPVKRKRTMTEAWRKALARAHAARRAKSKAAKQAAAQLGEAPAIEADKPKKKRNISEAGRRAMSLAGKRRWAKARRAAKFGM